MSNSEPLPDKADADCTMEERAARSGEAFARVFAGTSPGVGDHAVKPILITRIAFPESNLRPEAPLGAGTPAAGKRTEVPNVEAIVRNAAIDVMRVHNLWNAERIIWAAVEAALATASSPSGAVLQADAKAERDAYAKLLPLVLIAAGELGVDASASINDVIGKLRELKAGSSPSDDTRRLEWLKLQHGSVIFCGKWGYKCETTGGLSGTGTTPIEAFNAAMSSPSVTPGGSNK